LGDNPVVPLTGAKVFLLEVCVARERRLFSKLIGVVFILAMDYRSSAFSIFGEKMPLVFTNLAGFFMPCFLSLLC
jgi:hypothetical protein